jgi:hypothetical protein
LLGYGCWFQKVGPWWPTESFAYDYIYCARCLLCFWLPSDVACLRSSMYKQRLDLIPMIGRDNQLSSIFELSVSQELQYTFKACIGLTCSWVTTLYPALGFHKKKARVARPVRTRCILFFRANPPPPEVTFLIKSNAAGLWVVCSNESYIA